MSDIVISGIAGRFPKSENVEEFKENLFKKVYLVGDNEDRVKFKFAKQPSAYGMMKNIDKFDYSAFRVPAFIAKCCDPQGRFLAETVYEAIYDAGVSPKSLMGSNTGVYVGCFNYDSLEHWMFNKDTSLGMTSIANTAYALSNRISYLLGCHGPSLTVDTACSSSMYALNLAYNDMLSGKCDAAVVAGSNLILNPFITKDFAKAGVLAVNGISRPFDKNSSGFVRAEACCVLFLQRESQSRRVYAKVLNSKTNNDGYKIEGPTVPSVKIQRQLYSEIYDELKMDPHDVDFIEAHATSTGVGDKGEINSIDEYFCVNRAEPLKIGSVKGNMGHAEGAACTVGVTKALLMFETGKVIPNINITELRDDCAGLTEGRIRIVRETEDFDGKIIGVNGFGVLGANGHAVLQRNEKVKVNGGFPGDAMPRLLCWAGRTVDAVNLVFDNVSKKSFDDEFFALLQCAQIESSVSTLTRGYAIYNLNAENRQSTVFDRQVKELTKQNRPIVFAYSGVGSQWLQMGRDLLKIPALAESIQKCHEVLSTRGINLIKIITSDDPTTFNTCLNIFVGVASIQIALTDLLHKLGVKPNFIIGHSVGELGCAYADGTLTLEETILTAFSRGQAILEGVSKPGAMAAVAMCYNDLSKILPAGIEIACHNSSESCTISGDVESVANFVKRVKADGNLAKVVDSSGIAFHSTHIAHCGSILREKLNKIITDPKKRSPRWISTSVTKDENSEFEYSSASYHVNNMLKPVKFADVLSKLPEESIVIEIAPHGLLLPILKKALPNGIHESLTSRAADDGLNFLLQALGRIYQSGVDLDVRQMYPKIDFPVSRGTEMISPLVKWNHSESFPAPMYDPFLRCDKRNLSINLHDPTYAVYKGHKIDGRIIFPGTGYMLLVAETLAMMHGTAVEEMPVCFEDVKFLKSTILNETQEIDLTVTIHRGSGDFEVVERDETICNGKIRTAFDEKFMIDDIGEFKSEKGSLNKDDFYKELRLRGYQYEGDFNLVQSSQIGDGTRRYGKVEWKKSFITFIDCMIQNYFTAYDSRELSLPVAVRKCIMNPIAHKQMIDEQKNCKTFTDEKGVERTIFDVLIDDRLNVYRSGGVEAIAPEFTVISRRKNPTVAVLETYEFVSHYPTQKMTSFNAAKFIIQLFMENTSSPKFSIVEIDSGKVDPLMTWIADAIIDLPLITPSCHLITERVHDEIKEVATSNYSELSNLTSIDILIATEQCNMPEIATKMSQSGLLMFRGVAGKFDQLPKTFKLIAQIQLENELVSVFRNTAASSSGDKLFQVPTSMENFEWIENLKSLLTQENGNVTLFTRNSTEFSGILGFFNCLKRETGTKSQLRCFMIEDSNAPEFNLENPFYKAQYELGLSVNVYKSGKWGTYRHLNFSQNVQDAPQSDHCYIHQLVKGDISSLSWVNGDLKSTDKDAIDVYYSSLNFRDILVATQRISVDYEFPNRTFHQYKVGFEFSGITKDGRRVTGTSGIRGLTNMIKEKHLNDDLYLLNVPDSMSLEEAATLPVIYFTVYTAFFFKTKIEAGKSILIHSGSGGIGQCAIRVALAYGLKVYTTVGSVEKREFLLKEFPQLQDSDIGNSRDLSFERMILEATNGRGVDYVLNSLAEDKMQASIRCLARHGVFLEVGKFDILNGNKIVLKHLLNEIDFKGIFVSNKTLAERPEQTKQLLSMIQNDINNGTIKAIKRTVFPANEIEKAFRFMSSGKHVGKVMVQVRDPATNTGASLPVELKPRVNFDTEKVYIVPGGMGGMGMELVDWMVMRNCRKVVLSSSRGISNSYQSYRIGLWSSYGVKVVVSTENISTKEGCMNLIKTASQLGDVGGIFNLAASLQDGLFENQTADKFEKSIKPKALAAKHLDEVSRQLCPNLDFFVVFSSVSCGRGNSGQTNYGLANSITERIVERRRADNLPGKAIQWGPIGDVGMLQNVDAVALYGFNAQGINSCLEVLDKLLLRPEPIFSSLVCSSKKREAGDGSVNLFETLISSLGLDMSSIDENAQLASLGLDSISGTEIQQMLERELDITMSMKEIRAKTLKQVKELIAERQGAPSTSMKSIAQPLPVISMNDTPFMPFQL